MKNIKQLLFGFIALLIFITISAIPAYADSADCIVEAKNYYKQYGFDLKIEQCENKYSGTSTGKYKYAITYVTKGGEVVNLLLNVVPNNFNLWNTDVLVTDGRVVVTGVNGDSANTWNIVFAKYKLFIVGVTGLAALSCIFAFILTFIKMGALATNPQERGKFMSTLLFTGLGATGLGAVALIFGFFWNAV